MTRTTVDAAATATFPRTPAGDRGVYPVITVAGGKVVAAWTSGGGTSSVIRVELF
jgi:hypothetical protein